MLKLIQKNPFILFFGTLQIFFAAPGQSFLIAFFVTDFIGELNISRSLFTSLYGAATLTASLFLIPAGRLIDRHPIKWIVLGNTIGMAAGCLLLAQTYNVVTLFAGLFLVRLIGQGVFGLTASTLLIKKFHRNRGKAMGLINLGFPLSEAIFPSLTVFLLSTVGWRMTYLIFAGVIIGVMGPLQIFLLKKARLRRGEFLPGELEVNPQHLRGEPEKLHAPPHVSLTLRETLRDTKFYLLLTASCIPPLVMTGLLIHQDTLYAANGWPIGLAAAGLGFYAFCKATGSVLMGPFVDNKGPLGPFILIILMIAAGTFVPALSLGTWSIFVYFGLLGTALGFSSPVMNVVWPMFYGIKHMGIIKGFIGTFRNGLTAFGAVPIAMALDAGHSMQAILLTASIGIFLLTSLPVIVWKMEGKRLAG